MITPRGVWIGPSCGSFVLAFAAVSLLIGCQPSSPSGATPGASTKTRIERTAPAVAITTDAHSNPASRPLRESDLFEDHAAEWGVNFTYHNGREAEKYSILESLGGGAALFDFDGNDELDLFLSGGGTFEGNPTSTRGKTCALFRKVDDRNYRDIAADSRVDQSETYTLSCNVCDFNCDGHPDLFITGFPRCHLYQNQGDGTFDDVTATSELALTGLHATSAWGDFDNDGFPDLFVTRYVQFDLRDDRDCGDRRRHIKDVCGVWQYLPAQDQMFHNRGDGTFEETTAAAELRGDGRGLGAVAADINADGHLDLYAANDYTPNFLYLGDGHGRFTESGLTSGTSLDENGKPQGSMGVDFGDFDGDGLGDLFVTNYQLEDNILYHNLGGENFEVVTTRVGLQDICRPYVGFGTGWIDFDSDGWLDLVVLNGHVMYHPGQNLYEQPQFLFRNVEGRRFLNSSDQGGPYFSISRVTRGGAVGDLNNDGAPDLVTVQQNAPVNLLINRRAPENWIRVCLRGTTSEPFAAGAVVTSRLGERQLVRHIHNGGGYFSSFDRRVLLPVDTNGPIECSVRWLSGRTERFRNLPLRQTSQLIEGQGEPL